MRTLVTGVSGYVGSELAGRLRADGHVVRGFARTRARVSAAVDELVLGDVITGAGLEDALEGIDVAYYLVHSMEQRHGRSVRGARAHVRPGVRRRRPVRRPAPGRLPRRPRAGRRAALPPPRLPAGGRARAAGRGAGGDRPARVDRNRRPLALVPLPRPPDRAAARAGAAGVAREPDRADRRARRDGVPGARRHRPRRRHWSVVGHRRPGRDDLRRHDHPHLRRDDGPPSRRWVSASRSRRSPPWSRRRSPARIPR